MSPYGASPIGATIVGPGFFPNEDYVDGDYIGGNEYEAFPKLIEEISIEDPASQFEPDDSDYSSSSGGSTQTRVSRDECVGCSFVRN